MRALHVISAVAASDGGPSVAIRGMTAALAARGVDVSIVTTDADGPRRLPVPLGVPVDEGGVAVRYFPRTAPGRYRLSLSMARWLDVNVGTFDVVHVHGLWDWASLAGCRLARRHGVPYVVRTLGMLDPWSLSVRRWKKMQYFRAVERSHLRHAFAIHTTAPSEAAALAALGFGDRARVIALGVSPPAWVKAVSRAGRDGPVRLVFLSRLHPKKRLPLLLEALGDAVARGADLILDVIGDGEGAYVAGLREQTAPLAARVRFRGHLDGDAKWRALAAADIFVLPSSQENFGIAVAEALAAGLPVIVSDQVAIANAVTAARAGTVLPLDRDRLTTALIELTSDPARRAAMGERARDLAASSYSWEECARHVEALYAEALYA